MWRLLTEPTSSSMLSTLITARIAIVEEINILLLFVVRYIGLPSCHARYEILRSCIEELRRVRILQPSTQPLFMYQELMRRNASRKRVVDHMTSPPGAENGSEDLELSTELLRAAEMAEGFSGRALRKLPFQAHAFFVQV